MLEDWASEETEDTITERYSIGPGDIRGKVDTARWLLGAGESLSAELGLGLSNSIREARRRVEHGVRAELVELAGVRGVGRKRARRLYRAGIETPADLREAAKPVVLGALRNRSKTAEKVLDAVDHPDPSMDGVEPSSEVMPEESQTNERADQSGEDGQNQSNLGDF